MSNLKVREIVLAALFIALITAGTFIRIPIGGTEKRRESPLL